MSLEFHTELQPHLTSSGDMLSQQISGSCDFGGTMGTETARFVFEDVAQELSDPLRRYLERLVGNRATADDLVQETLVKIARALPGFEGRSSVKTWAFTIATRVATDHFRRPHSRARMVEVDESAPVMVSDAEIDQRLVIDEMNTCVREVIDSLPEDYRTALVLHDLEGQTAVQTAEIVGCSLATAKIRIHRARLNMGGTLK
jgi:RNA polymerase sigma-70 factor (ECF subfamily)